jgi:hypothetical protein
MFQECDITGGEVNQYVGGRMCSYHLCAESSSPITCVSHLACILSVFQECDITGGDIKEVNQYVGSVYAMNCLQFLFF